MPITFVKDSIEKVDSDQEEYSYHLEQARHFLDYAEKAQQDMEDAMAHFHRHNDWLKQLSNKTFMPLGVI